MIAKLISHYIFIFFDMSNLFFWHGFFVSDFCPLKSYLIEPNFV